MSDFATTKFVSRKATRIFGADTAKCKQHGYVTRCTLFGLATTHSHQLVVDFADYSDYDPHVFKPGGGLGGACRFG